MANTGLDLLMENLKQIIYCDNNPMIKSNLFVQEKRPQILFLYQELEYLRTFVIEIEVVKEPNELEKVRNLERRVRDLVEEVEDIVDLFLTGTFIRHNTSMTICGFDSKNRTLNVDRVMEEIKSIKEEIMDNKMQSRLSVETSIVGNPSSAVLKNKIIVGLEDASMVLVERITGSHKKLDIISVVGMGGLGKTTLATKVFSDRFIVYHFHIRAWVLVSQSYSKKDLLISLLTSISKLAPEKINKLRIDKISELLYKSLKGKRYFIVIDDVWSAKAWDDLKMYFPNDNTRSRVLLTTRLSEIAFYAKPGGFTHFLRFLTDEESWELLRRKVFQEDGCPKRLIKPGMQIAKKCQGLPLAVVVIAGVLVKEDCKIPVRRLIWLWVAEGFIHEDGEKLLEEVAEDYLMNLVHRSVLIVAKRRSNGGIKACRIHDLLRELCLKKATEENFLQQISRHLALWSEVTKIPSSVCNLWNLQTLILKENYSGFMKLPENIAKMINLRHLWIEMIISIPEVRNPTNSHVFFNLQTISMLQLHGRAESLLKRIPNVRKLGCAVYGDQKDDAFPNFVLLDRLETLKVIQPEVEQVESSLSTKLISFPVTLKKLTLSGCRLPWSGMSKIQWLPNLEVLKLLNYAFEGPSWDTGEGQFRQLKFLKLQNLDIQQWDTDSGNFSCLKRLVLLECYHLKGIPDAVGDIPTLEMIDIDKRNHTLVKSANRIREEQHIMGNYELKVNVIGFLTSIR
ncbi:hypothetical protein OSB04_016134 [Centaurea solstitialis]|uniref:NB-ARC domain-containing protein n=1 Tax=Centaurea solstitialis TaxID=347529 RepID=A0AA38T0C5_9ASTR|nr:hypothetical protein OSB04_016134 [Centaurea solstitialis]